MIRISLPYIYRLAVNLEPIGKIEARDTPASSLWVPCVLAKAAVTELITDSIYAGHLRASNDLAAQFLQDLEGIINADQMSTISQYRMFSLRQTFEQYKTVLLADLGILNSYFVLPKGGFDTLTLLSWGEQLFPSDLTPKAPEVRIPSDVARDSGMISPTIPI